MVGSYYGNIQRKVFLSVFNFSEDRILQNVIKPDKNCGFQTTTFFQATNHPIFFLIVTGKVATCVQHTFWVKYVKNTLSIIEHEIFLEYVKICFKNFVNICLKNMLNIAGRTPGRASRPVFGEEWGPSRYLYRFSQSNRPSINVLLMEQGARATQALKAIARQYVPSILT